MSKLQSIVQHIDFDLWSELAKTDPDCFEQLRSQTLEDCIARSSDGHQDRLRCLQWRIDRVRDNASNPLAACVKISDMMWDTFSRLEQAYKSLENPQPGETAIELPMAKILPLRPDNDTPH